MRLRPLTRLIDGDERPNQFCRILGRETLLEQTLGRATRSVPPSRTVVALTQAHERFYAPLVGALSPGIALIQPANRGTAPAILYALLRVERQAPLGAVALMPSDHYVSDDAAFMAHVDAAFDAVDLRPDLAVLLGVTPTSPETEYGWIEPADALPVASPALLLRVRQLWEKPTRLVAESLLKRRVPLEQLRHRGAAARPAGGDAAGDTGARRGVRCAPSRARRRRRGRWRHEALRRARLGQLLPGGPGATIRESGGATSPWPRLE